jgi:hypothetical protein
MKTRFTRTAFLIPMWEASIEATFFPDVLVQELKPQLQLDAWGEDLSVMRDRLRLLVDEFVDGLFSFDKPEELWQKLRETDPKIVSLYYDRLAAASFALKNVLSDKETVEIPASWSTFVAQILYQKLPQ